MTLRLTAKEAGSRFCFTICDGCGTDDTRGEEKLAADGWTWDYYSDALGPHWCPQCSAQGVGEHQDPGGAQAP